MSALSHGGVSARRRNSNFWKANDGSVVVRLSVELVPLEPAAVVMGAQADHWRLLYWV